MFHLSLGLAIIILFNSNLINQVNLAIILIAGITLSIILTRWHVPVISWFIKTFDRNDAKFPGEGAVFYVLGCLIVLSIFEKNIALASIMVLALGDSVATLAGKRFGKKFLKNNKTVLDSFSGIEKLKDKLCQFDYFQCINEVITKVILGKEKYYGRVCFPSFGGFYMKRTEPFIEEIIKTYDQGKWIPKISKDQLISVIESLYEYSEDSFNKNPLEDSCWVKGGWSSTIIKEFMENK